MRGINMKINIVVGGRFHSGQLYHAFKKNGHDVKIYCTSPKRFFKGIDNKDIIFIPKPFQIIQKISKRRMPKICHEFDKVFFEMICSIIIRPCDILWGFNGDSLKVARKLKKQNIKFILDRACPHIEYQNNILTNESKNIGYPYSKFTENSIKKYVKEYELADMIVVPSEYSASSFEDKHYFSKVRILPLDSNISRKSFVPNDQKLIGDKKKLRIGVVGGSFLRKGIIYLLRALNSIKEDNIQLLIRAPQKNILSHEESLNLCKNLDVKFVPYLQNLNDFYKSIDLFILPSIDEGFGMVVFEALMNEVAVIASDHVGSIDGMEDGKHALIFNSGNADQLANKILILIHNNNLRKSIAANGKCFYDAKIKEGNTFAVKIEKIISEAARGK